MITYKIESINEVIGYSKRLSDAKEIAKKQSNAVITKLVGPYQYERFHAYYLVWNGKTFKRIKKL